VGLIVAIPVVRSYRRMMRRSPKTGQVRANS
jgi:biopolymer transport protein ExbB/TolQ